MNLVCVSGMADASASGGAGQVPTQRGDRERSPTRTPTTQEQQQCSLENWVVDWWVDDLQMMTNHLR